MVDGSNVEWCVPPAATPVQDLLVLLQTYQFRTQDSYCRNPDVDQSYISGDLLSNGQHESVLHQQGEGGNIVVLNILAIVTLTAAIIMKQ